VACLQERHQRLQRGHRLVAVHLGCQHDLVPVVRAERHHAEDAGRRDRRPVDLADGHRHGLLAGLGHEQRGGPGVQALGSGDDDVPFHATTSGLGGSARRGRPVRVTGLDQPRAA
jgi:hypothetical protein